MTARTHFATLARYHLWATQRLIEHVDRLSDHDYRRDAGLYFRSIHGTLNHLLVTDGEIWWRRFDEGVSPKLALDAELEADRAALRDRLIAAAARWSGFVERLDAARLGGAIDYVTTRGERMSLPFAATLAHVFNHGTHHRGQVTAAITAMGQACPELDLVRMLQAEARG